MNRKEELARITIDIPKDSHKRLKTFAALLGKSMREIVIESIEKQLLSKPNKITVKAIKDAKKGKGLVKTKDAEDLFNKLGL